MITASVLKESNIYLHLQHLEMLHASFKKMIIISWRIGWDNYITTSEDEISATHRNSPWRCSAKKFLPATLLKKTLVQVFSCVFANFLRTPILLNTSRLLLLHAFSYLAYFLQDFCRTYSNVNPLSANSTKWSNTLKQFVGKLSTNCLSVFDHFVGLARKVLSLRAADLPVNLKQFEVRVVNLYL